MAAATNTEWLQIYQINNIGNKTSNYAGFREILTANSAFFRPANLVINFTTDGTVNVADYISQCIAEFSDKPSILQVGTALLGSFVQYAWTGPNLNFDLDSFLPSQVQSKTIPNISIIRKLSSDGEEVYALTPNLLHFYLARLILVDNASSFSSSATAPWWKMRALFIHQRILDAPAASINDSILSAALEVEEVLKNNLGEEDPRIIGELNARFRLELGLVHHYYGRQAKGLDEFSKAQEATKLEWNITGALGKRTKFQTFDVTQLVLIAESKISGNRHDTDVGKAQNHPTLPETLALNDDTLLETIDYTDLKSKGGNLAVIDQCILLAMCINVKNSNPSDGLTTEQMKPFVSRILENPNNWMVHTMALLMRSRLEASKSRTAERSVLQLQALVDQMAAEHDSTPSERLNYIYSLGIPSKWELESELADRLISIGVVKSALEIFERLQLWDNVVSCLQMLEKSKQAEEIVRKQLEDNPKSPKLHCLLGDITKDPQHYYDAWTYSEQKYSRAMRSLGAHYFRSGEFADSVNCYSNALAINPLYENSWFVMGCAALRCEDWKNAQKAFQQTVLLNSDNGEAWTNLANVHVKLGKKREGWRAIREALRQHHDNAKIWDNYLFLSLDLLEFGESVRSMQRIFDIRSNPARAAELAKNPDSLVDLGCLEILVNAVVHDIRSADGVNTAVSTVPQIFALLDCLNSKISGSAKLFTLCAQFYTSQERYKLAIDFLGRAYRVYLHAPALNDDVAVFRAGADAVERLSEAYKELGPLEETPRHTAVIVESDGVAEAGESVLVIVCPDWKYQGRTVLRTFIGRTKDSYEGTPEHERLKELLASFAST